jgi:hypothetical protein
MGIKRKSNRRRRAATLLGSGLLAVMLWPRDAAAQVTVGAKRDDTWDTVSHITLGIGTATPFLMPRIYYSDPESTVGWKGRWHVSMLAPAMTLTAVTVLVEVPIKDAIESTRPGCTLEETAVPFDGCETFGGPSTHAFASWSATGAGTGIFLVDTFKWSDSRFHAGSFIGNVMVPLTASVFTSVARGAAPGTSEAHEDAGQIVAGALPGFFSGLVIGAGYALLQRPSCGYGDAIFCW